MDAGRLEEQVAALDRGGACVDRSHFHMVLVRGADAPRWLNDLVTAGVVGLKQRQARRSLLLTPTGRIRADFHVIRLEDGFLLVQDPSQPGPIEALLERYVLSSDVELLAADGRYGLFCCPGAGGEVIDPPASFPSMLGGGFDFVIEATAGAGARVSHTPSLPWADEEAVEVWRIRHGVARFPVDLTEDSLPAEAGLDALVDFSKGCFLGQESLAKVRNLGHPAWAVVALRAEGAVAAGERVTQGRRDMGSVTSAAPAPEGTALIARVRWEARNAELCAAAGLQLRIA